MYCDDQVPIDPLDTKLYKGVVVQCRLWIGSCLPFVVCVVCFWCSPQSRNLNKPNGYKLSVKRHFRTDKHKQKLVDINISNNSGVDFLNNDIPNFNADDASVDHKVSYSPLHSSALDGSLFIVTSPNLDCCEYFNERTKQFYEQEHLETGLGFSNIIKTAFDISAHASLFSREEVAFHLQICRLCADSTRSQLHSVGMLLDRVILYFGGIHTKPVPVQVTPDMLIQSFQKCASVREVSPLSPNQQCVLRQVMNESSTQELVEFSHSRFSSFFLDGLVPKKRGIFQATYPPRN